MRGQREALRTVVVATGVTVAALGGAWAAWKFLSGSGEEGGGGGHGDVSAEEFCAAARAGDCARLTRLLERGADVNCRTQDGESPLLWASNGGFVAAVRLLLEAGANVGAAHSGSEGMTAAHFAAGMGHTQVLELLLEAGAPDSRTFRGALPLHLAAMRGHYRCVALLIDHGSPVDALDSDGNTPLFLAAKNGATRVVEELLRAGAKCHLECDGVSPLLAAANAGAEGTLAALLDAGASGQMKEAFFGAVERGDAKVTALLCAAGHKGSQGGGEEREVEVERRGEEGEEGKEGGGDCGVLLGKEILLRGLVLGARRGQLSVVRQLCRVGLGLDEMVGGWSALLVAADAGHRRVCRELVAFGAEVDKPHPTTGMTALMLAAARGHAALCTDLVTLGANPNTPLSPPSPPTSSPSLPIHVSSTLPPPSPSLPSLIDLASPSPSPSPTHHASPSPTTTPTTPTSPLDPVKPLQGRTALMWAAVRGRCYAARALLSAGADPSMQDEAGRTARDLATNRCSLLRTLPAEEQQVRDMEDMLAVLAAAESYRQVEKGNGE